MSAVSQAIDKYGGRYKLAKDLGVTWSGVDRWYKSGVVPLARCREVAEKLGVPREKLNREFA